jgi:hypothetical protein
MRSKLQCSKQKRDEPCREPERRSQPDLKWTVFRRRPVTANVSRPIPDRNFRAVSWVRLMARLLEDCVKAAIFVTVVTEYSLGANWLRKNIRTPNYPSFGLLYGYKLGDSGSLHLY